MHQSIYYREISRCNSSLAAQRHEKIQLAAKTALRMLSPQTFHAIVEMNYASISGVCADDFIVASI